MEEKRLIARMTFRLVTVIAIYLALGVVLRLLHPYLFPDGMNPWVAAIIFFGSLIAGPLWSLYPLIDHVTTKYIEKIDKQ